AYQNYVELAKQVEKRPTVFSDKPFASQWYVPGGKSYIAQLFKDAGADYVWKADSGLASFPLDYELVYKKAVNADYWRIVGSYNDEASHDFLESQNELFTHFDAFKNKKIIWCDAKNTSYFEKGPLEPQILLADLVYCFHPDLLPDYQPVYYRILK
ncbi:MAG: iron ABC transporter substrate-binding protein, partial [Marinilabiliales bacterium]